MDKLKQVKEACRDYALDAAGSLKPLFIPLKTEYYEAFERGDKDEEYRLYGKRWNENTCLEGREVTLSKGYGKKHRLTGEIIGFQRVDVNCLTQKVQDSLSKIYPNQSDIAAIEIKLNTPKDKE